jgi:hypothetical protein
MTVPIDPISDPSAWDAVEVASVEYPYCEVTGFKRAHKWDVKEGKGAFGATTTFVNEPLAEGDVKFLAWETFHFALFDQILQQLKYNPAKKQTNAVDVYHPALADIDAHSFVGTEISQWEHDGEGLYTRVVHFQEFRPAAKTSAVATPTMSTANDPNAVPGTPPDPAVTAAQTEFQKALDDAKSLGPL